jgi:hypothetical protein
MPSADPAEDKSAQPTEDKSVPHKTVPSPLQARLDEHGEWRRKKKKEKEDLARHLKEMAELDDRLGNQGGVGQIKKKDSVEAAGEPRGEVKSHSMRRVKKDGNSGNGNGGNTNGDSGKGGSGNAKTGNAKSGNPESSNADADGEGNNAADAAADPAAEDWKEGDWDEEWGEGDWDEENQDEGNEEGEKSGKPGTLDFKMSEAERLFQFEF